MATAKSRVNLIFQGGGVRGIAYAGALEPMPHDCDIDAVGGTSAGSIVAALLAIGVRGQKLADVLKDQRVFNLLDKAQMARVERIKTAVAEAQRLWPELKDLGAWRAAWRLRGFRKRHRGLLADLNEVWSSWGLHESSIIRQWLNDILKDTRFKDIRHVTDLRIVAADVSRRRYKIYSKEDDADTPIAVAVHASISIPLFFQPFKIGPDPFVDGGIVSNFPSFLFAQSKYPTIGFRLIDLTPPTAIDSPLSYAKGLLFTMVEAHDKWRGEPPRFKAYDIVTPPTIPSTKFALEQRDLDELYVRGRDVGRSVDWHELSSTTTSVSFYDPRSHEALSFSLSEAYKLWQANASRELWVDELIEDVEWTARIESDWSTEYRRVWNVQVKGARPMFVGRSFAETSGSTIKSLMDVDLVAEEITTGAPKNLIRIPAFNQEKEKGYIVFFLPPLAEGQPVRRFRTVFKVEKEFAETLGRGKEDSIGYQTRKRAERARLRLQLGLWLNAELPRLKCTPEFNCQAEPERVEVDPQNRRSYRVLRWVVEEGPVEGTQQYTIKLESP